MKYIFIVECCKGFIWGYLAACIGVYGHRVIEAFIGLIKAISLRLIKG